MLLTGACPPCKRYGLGSNPSGLHQLRSGTMGGMGYRDPEKQRAYMRRWLRKRRATWIKANGPCRRCGSSQRLEVDHVDPAIKVAHNVWGWSEKRRAAELKKCQVLCYYCHLQKTHKQRFGSGAKHGTHARYTSKRFRCRCSRCKAAHRLANARWRKLTGRTQAFYNHLAAL